MMISVIVAVYNIEQYIPLCIESIINQSYENLNIIIVDDGSTDSSGEICDNYALKDKRIKVIHQSNKGLVNARKTGLLNAKGDYISYIDGDDWLEKDFYENMVNLVKEYNPDVVASGFIKSIGNICIKYRNLLSDGVYTSANIRERIIPSLMDVDYPSIYSYCWNKIFKRELLLYCQQDVDDSITLGEDAAFVYPAIALSNVMVISSYCGYYYRQRANSMLKDAASFNNYDSALNNLYEFFYNRKETYLLKYVIYLKATINGGIEIIDNRILWHHYNKYPIGNRLAIYGAGTFGQHLFQRLVSVKDINIVAWVDRDYLQYNYEGLDVENINTLQDIVFDNLIIATTNTIEKQDFIDRAISMGISMDKIMYIKLRYDR